jgi:hypothetical protein
MYFVKVSVLSSLISSAIISPLLVMMIEPNIDAERFFTYVLPTFIPSYSCLLFVKICAGIANKIVKMIITINDGIKVGKT